MQMSKILTKMPVYTWDLAKVNLLLESSTMELCERSVTVVMTIELLES